MKHHHIFFSLFILLLGACQSSTEKTIIAFGSCSREFDTLQMWDNVLSHQPVVWIWMGDNIYGDTYDMDVMAKKYVTQKERPSYQKLINSTKIYGAWDDHDYGINDGGKEYRMKKESKKLMLEFLDVPKTNSVWQREGTYQSYNLDANGKKVKLILLDTRYFRDSLERNLNPPPNYTPNYTGSVLGEEQWKWFEVELTGSDADIHLIGSSIQVIPDGHAFEKWGNFPEERKRFFDLLARTKPARPLILSGDRHIAEFSKIELDDLPYPVYEFTSSGLTHTWKSPWPEENEHRIGELIIAKNFGLIELDSKGNDIQLTLKVMGEENQLLVEIVANY